LFEESKIRQDTENPSSSNSSSPPPRRFLKV